MGKDCWFLLKKSNINKTAIDSPATQSVHTGSLYSKALDQYYALTEGRAINTYEAHQTTLLIQTFEDKEATVVLLTRVLVRISVEAVQRHCSRTADQSCCRRLHIPVLFLLRKTNAEKHHFYNGRHNSKGTLGRPWSPPHYLLPETRQA